MRISDSVGAGGVQAKAAEILENRKLFKSFDKDSDLSLNLAEFKEFAKTLGLNGEELFKKIDKQNKGKISFNDFSRSLPEIFTDLFKLLDKNKDGVIDQKELKQFADQYHFDLQKLMALLDPKKSGKISEADFVKNFGDILRHPADYFVGAHKTKQKEPTPSRPSSRATYLRSLMQPKKTTILDLLSPHNKIDLWW